MSNDSNFNVLIKQLIEQLNKNFGIENAIITNDSILKCGGFSSTLNTATIKGLCNNKQVTVEVIIKRAPSSIALRQLIPFKKIFEREIYFYTTIWPTFQELRKCVNETVPKCYFTTVKLNMEALVLENLSKQNFLVKNKRETMNLNHIRLVLREYVKLHAFSFILRKENPIKLMSIAQNTKDIYMDIIEKCKTSETIKNLITKVLESMSLKETDAIINQFKKFQLNIINIMKDAVKHDFHSDDYGVLCHGDNWCNNMLFRYKDEELNSPTEVRLIDWQLARFGSPVLDLSYFLYTSCEKNTLDELNILLSEYHSVLEEILKQAGYEIGCTFPFSVLMEHWKKYAKFGLGMAFLVVHVMLMDDGEVPDVTTENQSGEDFVKAFGGVSKLDAVYVNRMRDIVVHFFEQGLLD